MKVASKDISSIWYKCKTSSKLLDGMKVHTPLR